MAKQKLTAFQKKTLESILNGISIADAGGRSDGHFYYFCPNDHCCGKNGHRAEASAWKLESDIFLLYCSFCGQDIKMTKTEFSTFKKQVEDEKKISLSQKKFSKKKVAKVNDSNYYIDEYLDNEG